MGEKQLEKKISVLMDKYNMSAETVIGEDGKEIKFSLGKVHIFNNQTFDDPGLEPRSGSREDVNALIKTFKDLNFSIPEVHDDLEQIPFLQEIKNIAKDENDELKHSRSLFCVFLSHGEAGHILMKDEEVEIDQIYKILSTVKNENLRNKPKIFIFQACRGSKGNDPGICDAGGFMHEDTTPVSSDVENLIETGTTKEYFYDSDGLSGGAPRGADCLTAYSTTKGYVSFRSTNNGSWFIQKLCEVFSDYAAGTYDDYHPDIMQLLTLVSAKVSERFTPHPKYKGRIIKQMPSFVSSLRKRLFLRDHPDVPVQKNKEKN